MCQWTFLNDFKWHKQKLIKMICKKSVIYTYLQCHSQSSKHSNLTSNHWEIPLQPICNTNCSKTSNFVWKTTLTTKENKKSKKRVSILHFKIPGKEMYVYIHLVGGGTICNCIKILNTPKVFHSKFTHVSPMENKWRMSCPGPTENANKTHQNIC